MIGIHPYKFTPLYKPTIWGGRALERLFGRPLRQDARVGESWELAELREAGVVNRDDDNLTGRCRGLIEEIGKPSRRGAKDT